MTKKQILFYIVLATIVVSQTVATLFHSAIGLTQHAQFNTLEREKIALQQDITQLQISLASQNSVKTVAQSDLKQRFQPIDDVRSVRLSDTLAAAQ
ncbi:hypothetical protein KC921_02330 [Candidatus Woesebacteria bacterium]|nr:hypothetical protein [Candidatus Woesebacteria bacterium]